MNVVVTKTEITKRHARGGSSVKGGFEMKKNYLALVMGLLVLLVGVSAWGADVTQELYFTQKTTLTAGATYTFRFSLWDDETAGNSVWEEEKSVKLTGTTIKTYLGDATIGGVAGVNFSQQLWVEVERYRPKFDDYVVLGPRTMLGVVPYAMWAVTPSGLQGATGPTGPTGDTGPTGPTGAQERLEPRVSISEPTGSDWSPGSATGD